MTGTTFLLALPTLDREAAHLALDRLLFAEAKAQAGTALGMAEALGISRRAVFYIQQRWAA